MVYRTRDYPCAINRLNNQVAGHRRGQCHVEIYVDDLIVFSERVNEHFSSNDGQLLGSYSHT